MVMELFLLQKKMKFKTLINTNSWLSVKAILLKLYPDEEKSLAGYKEVFNKLLVMKPAEDEEINIEVVYRIDEFDGDEYVDVSGKYKNPKNEEEEFLQAIEYPPWKQWLGMDICEESLYNFSQMEIIAHCLYEMTFAGFEEEEIQKQLDSFKLTVEEYKNMTDEEKKTNTTSLDDLLKDFERNCKLLMVNY